MSTDSTELTFVRCPSCRSLVPAVSTRCRMCGANLENTAGGAAPGDQEKPEKSGGRVRQRTMSQAEHELASVVEQVRTETTQEAPTKKEAMLIEDPLSAYLEEVEVEEGLVQQSPKPEPGFPAPSVKNGGGAESAKELSRETRESQERPARSNEPAPMMRGQGQKQDEEPIQDDKGKVIVESGARKFGKPSGLSFGKSIEQKTEQKGDYQKVDAPKPAQERPPRERFQDPLPEQPIREQKRVERREERRDERKEERREPPQREQPLSSSRRIQEDDSTGVLVGWLVSFDKPERSAIELRSGKFFVTGSRMRPSDLVISNPSVSSPHALVIVGDGGVVKVQDLMSEQGVFVSRTSKGSTRETEVTTLEHGDTVRFGDVEFVISLLPKSVGR